MRICRLGQGAVLVIVMAVGLIPIASADSVCDPSLDPAEGKWGIRWGTWSTAIMEPLFHVGCVSSGRAGALLTNTLNAGALEWLQLQPGSFRRADVSFMVQDMTQWNHVAVLPAYDPGTIGRIGTDVFHDTSGVDPDRLVIQYNKTADTDCQGSNLHSWMPIPGGLQINHWYRVSSQISQRADGGLDIIGTLQDVQKEDRPIIVSTAYSAPVECKPAWFPADARWAIGSMGSAPGIPIYLDDFAGQPVADSLAYQEAGGQVVMESEHADRVTPRNGKSWDLKIGQAGYSGNSYVEALPNTGVTQNSGYVTASPELSYRVRFSRTGTYYVWLRGAAPTSSDGTVHVGLDGSGPSTADRMSGFGTNWTWSRATLDGSTQYARLSVNSTGVHTIHIWMREDGFRVDKLVLRTSSSSTPPADTGLAESPRVP